MDDRRAAASSVNMDEQRLCKCSFFSGLLVNVSVGVKRRRTGTAKVRSSDVDRACFDPLGLELTIRPPRKSLIRNASSVSI